ncbi:MULTISPECIES: pilus assembly protein TadG-related protein [unclassified Streptomyces]|uniref:pilus assembly protein TadG-related protein n=1 Tax=unclassified Streptomyces TaxID=2593676 RepID=UPI00044C4390|nr:pilus assembly protein TadG-related protein [Streptomyces sp. PCS3-D2]WKV72131.1 pilus assembly protein TadG-related protein [Streptomyces sp. PCS3-D2]
MATRGTYGRDRGQAFPIYVVVVAGLLFAALAFFAVGQASVRRSDAQGAADAAALAAGREARDKVLLGLDLPSVDAGVWKKIVDGRFFKVGEACAAAEAFAAKNDAKATCAAALPRFTVTVETNGTVGDSVVPGTNGMHATAKATALIEPRCHLASVASPSPTPTPTSTAPSGGASPSPTPNAAAVTFTCGGEMVKLDPSKPGSLKALTRKLFSVRLVG